MSYDFGMERFDIKGETAPKHPRVLDDILIAIQQVIPPGSNRYLVEKRGRKTLEVQLASGLGVVHPDHAAFNIHDFDHDTDLQVLYAIARAGDMVVFTEGNTHILTNPKQRRYLPDYGFKYEVHLARNWQALALLLREDADPAAEYRKQVDAQYENVIAAGQPPNGGTHDTAVYVQPRKGEMALDHLDRLFSEVGRFFARRGNRRSDGWISGTCWSLRIPTGECFLGYEVRGNLRDWMQFFRAHSKAGDCRYGRIDAAGKKFVLDDGRVYPMKKCVLRQRGDDEVVE